ncbi:MAG TPA: hypothetical protein VE093_46655 [Polyangiaceae bacterium]|jgi:hypothetical protein|nr:hypothetical protein [Polyangiaceae bacterium]
MPVNDMKLGLMVLAIACAAAACESSEPKGPPKADPPTDTPKDGMWETDTSPSMKLSIKGAPEGHFLRADRLDNTGRRELFHSNGEGEPVKVEFLPPGFILYPQAAHVSGATVVCGVTGPSLNVATNDYKGSKAACAVRGKEGFGPAVAAGSWLFDVCADAPSASAPNGSFAVLYVDRDNPWAFSGDGQPACQKVVWDGQAWSAPAGDACHCAQRIGASCSDPCFKEAGTRAANGGCSLPAAKTPVCAATERCTGNVNQLCVPKQL